MSHKLVHDVCKTKNQQRANIQNIYYIFKNLPRINKKTASHQKNSKRNV